MKFALYYCFVCLFFCCCIRVILCNYLLIMCNFYFQFKHTFRSHVNFNSTVTESIFNCFVKFAFSCNKDNRLHHLVISSRIESSFFKFFFLNFFKKLSQVFFKKAGYSDGVLEYSTRTRVPFFEYSYSKFFAVLVLGS